MTHIKSWTLTDVAADVWLDSFRSPMTACVWPRRMTGRIRKRTLRGGLHDGVDLIEIHNGALSYAILPTRSMGFAGECRGNYLGWRAPVQGPVHPKFVNTEAAGGVSAGCKDSMSGWCVAGSAPMGRPGEDSFTDKSGKTRKAKLSLHGNIANRPAHLRGARRSRAAAPSSP